MTLALAAQGRTFETNVVSRLVGGGVTQRMAIDVESLSTSKVEAAGSPDELGLLQLNVMRRGLR